MAVDLATLLIRTTKERFYEIALSIAEGIGLPVSSWQAGDPTRSLYHVEATVFDKLEEIVHGFINGGWLDYAEPTFWLKLLAKQMFNVDVPEATFATTDVVLTNAGGGNYPIEPRSLTFRSSLSGKTYTNTTGGTLAPVGNPGATLTVTVEAEEAGSDSSAGPGEIDEIVDGFNGVTCTNPTAAVGLDEQDRATTIKQCRDKLGMLSPNGPKDAYSFVARDSELTGTSAITRVRVYSESDTGDVTVYLAGPSGAVDEADRALVEEAIAQWSTPLCITPEVLSASNVTIAVTYQLWIYKRVNKTAAEVQSDVSDALAAMLATLEIGGDVITPGGQGYLYKSLIESTILGTFDEGFRVTVSLPTGDTEIDVGEVAVLGTVTGTITFVTDA